MDIAEEIASRLIGQRLTEVERSDYDWHFLFANDASFRVACPWRIVAERRIAIGDSDHEPKFGASEVIDVAERANELLRNKAIGGVVVRRDTGDLAITFGDETVLEILNMSSAYEGWEFTDDAGLNVIAQGGGEIAVFDS
jgi:hypothetical protein